MLVVNAGAGTGKTTTAMFGLGTTVPKSFKLSDEQKDIVRRMREYKWSTCAAMAFNKAIAMELEKRVPKGVVAATANAFGHRALVKHTGVNRPKITNYKTSDILKSNIAVEFGWSQDMVAEKNNDITKLVSLLKGSLLDPTEDNMVDLCDYHGIAVDSLVFQVVPRIMDISIKMLNYWDYDDQLFMTVKLNASLPKFDLVLVDEAQDLNAAKQELAFRMLAPNGNMVIIGDRRQAIYGFAGADSRSMDTMAHKMRLKVNSKGFEELPLTITRRCPKSVVKRVNMYVPELKAADDAPEGTVTDIKESVFTDWLIDNPEGCMVICRTNAPLAALAFQLIKAQRRCFIQGKDLGQGLKTLLKKAKTENLSEAMEFAINFLKNRILKLRSSGKAEASDKIDFLEDQILVMQYLAEGINTVTEFKERVDELFKDHGQEGDHQLTSAHKSKGLEKDTVCIYKPSKLPLPPPKKKKGASYSYEQEKNLTYVAYTRAMDTLMFVIEDKKTRDMDI